MSLRVGGMFAGYGGLDLAISQVLDAEPAWFAEYEAAPSRVLARHWPGVPNHGDVTRIDWTTVEPVDVIAGGSPCQDLSTAGNRKGMTDGPIRVARNERTHRPRPHTKGIMMNLTAHQFPAVYERHGIDLSRLGCVMLDVETPGWLARALRPEWLYTSPNQSHHWITGLQTRSHVTLRYGLLPDVVPLDVDEVLADWSKPDVVRVTGLRAFGSPFPDEDYRCIIGMVERADVIEAWRRLGFLPNVTRYDRYQPHVTLAYVHAARVEPAFAAINDAASFPFSLTALGLDYGDVIGGAK